MRKINTYIYIFIISFLALIIGKDNITCPIFKDVKIEYCHTDRDENKVYYIKCFNDNEKCLKHVLNIINNNKEYSNFFFVTNLRGLDYSDGITYTDRKNTDLFYFEKKDKDSNTFSFISIFLRDCKPINWKIIHKEENKSIYTGSFKDINFNILNSILEKTNNTKKEYQSNFHSYTFTNETRDKKIEINYDNMDNIFEIKLK